MEDTMSGRNRLGRREVVKAAAGLGMALVVPGWGAARAASKPFAGVELNVSCWSAPFPLVLRKYLPEFQELTGIKVNYDTPGFLIYNQRVDLELSTKGSGYDVLNITFIFVNRWLRAGWFYPLDELLTDENRTPRDWDVQDFFPAARRIMTGSDGLLYGIPWTCDVTIAAAGRFDLMGQAGLAMPKTFDDIEKVVKATHKNGVVGFVGDNRHGWNFPPYLQGWGGNVFRNPPEDLMPTLDTPEAVAAAEFYSRMLRDYGPDGVLSYTPDQLAAALKQGRANYATEAIPFLTPAAAADSKAAKTVRYSMFPKGPAGQFPGFATHAWGIPTTAKNKAASWEFIKWAMSKATMGRALGNGYSSPTRRSITKSAEFHRAMLLNGTDVADIYSNTVDIAGSGNYMSYRTVPVFPQIDALIGQAIERIVSKQMSASESMKKAQRDAISDLRRAGIKL